MSYTNTFTGIDGSPTSIANLKAQYDAIAAQINALEVLAGLGLSAPEEISAAPADRAGGILGFVGSSVNADKFGTTVLTTSGSIQGRPLTASASSSRTQNGGASNYIKYVTFDENLTGAGAAGWTSNNPESVDGSHFGFPRVGRYICIYSAFVEATTGTTSEEYAKIRIGIEDTSLYFAVDGSYVGGSRYALMKSVAGTFNAQPLNDLANGRHITMMGLIECNDVVNEAMVVQTLAPTDAAVTLQITDERLSAYLVDI